MEDYFIIKVGTENEDSIIKMLASSSIWYTSIEIEGKQKYFLIKAQKHIVKLFVQFENAIVLNENLLKELFNSKCNLQNYSKSARFTKRV